VAERQSGLFDCQWVEKALLLRADVAFEDAGAILVVKSVWNINYRASGSYVYIIYIFCVFRPVWRPPGPVEEALEALRSPSVRETEYRKWNPRERWPK